MSDNDQDKIIQEQTEANERLIQAVEHRQEGAFQGQAPVNERVIKQIQPNERVQQVIPQETPKPSEDKTE